MGGTCSPGATRPASTSGSPARSHAAASRSTRLRGSMVPTHSTRARRQVVAVPHLLDGLGGAGAHPARGASRVTVLAPEQGLDPLGGEPADRDDRVGAADRARDQARSPRRAEPAVGPRHVEDRQVVDGGHARSAGCRSGRSTSSPCTRSPVPDAGAGRSSRPAYAVGDGVSDRGDRARQLPDRIPLDVGDQPGCLGQPAQRAEELADVGLDTAATRSEGEGVEVDGWSRHRSTPNSSQK